ncbi:MAG: hypothetical protein ABIZ80_04645, partial [Bryobacteraceae bacterium]
MIRYLLPGILTFFSLQLDAAVGVRVVLGIGDKAGVKWDGSVTATGARITSITSWRFDADDAVLPSNAWRVFTRPVRSRPGVAPVVPNGVIVWLDEPEANASLQIQTAQGNFSVTLASIPYGKLAHGVNGRAMADRVPPVTRLTDSPDEQDFPAAATAKSGDVWLAYMEFKHHPEHDRLRANMKAPPSDLSQFATAPPGDQIFVKRYSQGQWGVPIAVSEPGGDLYRPAVAVDGSGRAWVFWPANQKQNFDLWAKPIGGDGKPGAAVRLSTDVGSDVNPVAATDAKGRVWVAWQAWRDGKAQILAVVQQGNGFGKAMPVSSSAGNEWNPVIAADGSGRISIAWDSYRNGNYDVFVRTTTDSGSWDKREVAAAATARYEAYPSIAYDPSGRLWVAYEEGGEGWGKDFGAHKAAGVAIYRGRAVRLRGFDRAGGALELAADVGSVLPGIASHDLDSTSRQNTSEQWLTPRLADGRDAVRSNPERQAPKNSMPRIQFDASGRLWLAARSLHPIWWNPIGHVWTEYLASFDGKEWTGPIFLTDSDNLLDNRPALVSTKAGQMLVVGSSDHRRQFQFQGTNVALVLPLIAKDPYNNDLYANTVELAPAKGAVQAKSTAGSSVPGVATVDTEERKMISAMRSYRGAGGTKVVRGEFHRHSEVSADGGAVDGMLIDQWCYIIDAAGMDWVGCCDHDNGGGREYTWWLSQKLTDMLYTPGKFSPLFSYERSVMYPEGHRNVLFAKRGIRTLPKLPKTNEAQKGRAPDTQMLYGYLRKFDGIVASHTSATDMGTDWRDNDPLVEPIVEIYQGDRQNYEMPGAPRTIVQEDAIGGWRPAGFVNLALEMGYRFGFQASSDHVSTHMSYCNILAKDATRESLMDALKKR